MSKKFQVIVSDPPWSFSDDLKMSKTKRGAKSNYQVMSLNDIKKLKVPEIVDKDAVLLLWCPSTLIPEGLEVMKEWGFKYKQTHIWVKTKKNPIKKLLLEIIKTIKLQKSIAELRFDISEILSFGMGHIFRQTHEVVLIGTKGKLSNILKNKSQRSVHFWQATKHSEKPEILQNMVDKMFPNSKKLEMFARRDRVGYTCVGLECPSTLNEDITISLEKLRMEIDVEDANVKTG